MINGSKENIRVSEHGERNYLGAELGTEKDCWGSIGGALLSNIVLYCPRLIKHNCLL